MTPSCNCAQRHRRASFLSVLSLVISIVAVPAAGWLAYHYTDRAARESEERGFRREASEGTDTLNAMGHLYFSTMYRISDLKNYNGGHLSFLSDQHDLDFEGSRKTYLAMLGELINGAKRLVNNSGYRMKRRDDQPGIEKLAAFRNYLAVEQAMGLNNPLFGTLQFMCQTFGNSYFVSWRDRSQFLLPDSLYSFSTDGVFVEVDILVGKIPSLCACVDWAWSKSLHEQKIVDCSTMPQN